MPELPEVETVVRDLRPRVVGRVIRNITTGPRQLRTPWNDAWNDQLLGHRFLAIRRRGKWIIVELDSGSRLLVHLGMTGQLTAMPATEPQPDHLHLIFALDDESELRFRDVRRFGSARLLADEETLQELFTKAKLGPEPFQLDPGYFRTAVQKANRSLKAILLDQRVVAGVGNIYADEACSRAGLHPGRRGVRLTPAEVDRLRDAILEVIAHAIEHRGSTIRDYIGGSGLRGGFQEEFRVYGRTGEPCKTCGSAISRLVIAGRSSHFCPDCQRMNGRGAKSTSRIVKRSPRE